MWPENRRKTLLMQPEAVRATLCYSDLRASHSIFIPALSLVSPKFADFFSYDKHAFLERMHITPLGIEDFAFSRRHIDNLSVWTMFQLLHSTLLESDRAARGRSFFEKKEKKNQQID